MSVGLIRIAERMKEMENEGKRSGKGDLNSDRKNEIREELVVVKPYFCLKELYKKVKF